MEWHRKALLGLFFIFFGVNILDFASTIYGVFWMHLVETNRFVNDLAKAIGFIPALVLGKILMIGMIGFTTWAVVTKTPYSYVDDDVMLVGLLLLNVIGFFVLQNNFGLVGWL